VIPWFAAWQIRNHASSGYSGFTSVTVDDLYFWEDTEIIATTEHRNFGEVGGQLTADLKRYLAEHPAPQREFQLERIAYMNQVTRRVFREHPGTMLLVRLKGSLRVFFSPGANDLFTQMSLVDNQDMRQVRRNVHDRGPVATAISFAFTYPVFGGGMALAFVELIALYLLSIAGLARGGTPRPVLWLMLGVALYIFGISGGALGGGRYREPVMPIVCILAACGLVKREKTLDQAV
jgi:hypothetical protein